MERTEKQNKTEFVWDANGRLVESVSNAKKTIYQYDPLGRRISKETDGITIRFYWDGDALLGDVTGNDIREWVYYPGSFEPLAMIHNEEFYLYHNEPNGCPSRLLDESGKVVWAARYDAWGKVKKLFVDEVEQPLRLQGQYFDGETGLYYNRFRYYEPTIGCFVSQDPLGLAAGENVYAYAPSTQKWIDPLGLCKVNKSEISDEDFVRFDPVKVRDSITKSGIQTKFFADKKVWFTKYKYVKDVTNPSDLETMLYRKNLQQYSTGKFSSGADLYRLKNISDAVPAGKTNMTNGIPQWRITRDIPASDIEMIKTLD